MKTLISIDLWMTLIKSNPNYKTIQTELYKSWFELNFNLTIDESEISASTRYVNKLVDKLSEDLLTHVSSEERLNLIVKHILIKNNTIINGDISKVALDFLYLGLKKAFLANMPLLIDNNLKIVLDKFKANNYDLAICSNTGLFGSDVMVSVLDYLDIKKYFTHLIFSNETGHSKPSYKMLEPFISNYDKVYHVGDNSIADNIKIGKKDIFKIIEGVGINFKNFNCVYDIIEKNNNDTITFIEIDNVKQTSLNISDYSRFKHGSKQVCQKYAKELSSKLFSFLKDKEDYNNILIYGAPYNKVPAASSFLVFDILKELRRLMPSKNFVEGKIHRKNSYHGDYGNMSKEERENVLKGEEFRFVTSYSNHDLAIFVDDIYITGTHEKLIKSLLDAENFNIPYIMAYYAKLKEGVSNPNIESHFNQFVLQNDKQIIDLFNEELYINTRNCKFFLKLPNKLLRTIVEKHQNSDLWEEIVSKAIANDYNNHELYKENFNFLKENKCQYQSI